MEQRVVSARTSSGCYDPFNDRSSLYSLPRRARFWPGSDELQGDDWQRCYGDIEIPRQLKTPRKKPSCLQNEHYLEDHLKERRAQQQKEQEHFNKHLELRRGQRSGSVVPESSSNRSCRCDNRRLRSSSAQRNCDEYEFVEANDRLNRLRAAKSSLLKEEDCVLTKERTAAKEAARYLETVKRSETLHSSKHSKHSAISSEQTSYLGLDGHGVHVPSWAASHPIKEITEHRQPPRDSVWPEKRPFYDLKSDYSAMLSFIGVPRK